MDGGKTRIIFDTSAINNLQDDPDREAIMAKLESSFWVCLLETNVGEVFATTNPERRMSLLDLSERLLGFGEYLMPHHWIVNEMASCHRRHRQRFVWQDVGIEAPGIADAIVERRYAGDGDLVKEQREHMRAVGREFLNILRQSRDMFEAEWDGAEELPSLPGLFSIIKADGGPFWKSAAGLYERATLATLSEQEIRAFVNACPPFHAVALVSGLGQYQYGLPKRAEQSRYKAHLVDLLMGCHLPYCDVFVTHERQQQNALKVIAREIGVPVDFQSYKEFSDQLSGRNVEGATA
jgi:hypothetical protein